MKQTIPTISVLLPCSDQKREFLAEAILSVREQTASDWELVVILETSSPPHVTETAAAQAAADPRIRVVRNEGFRLAGKLNTGMRHARAPFVAYCCSDDRLAPDALATLQQYFERFPRHDFFYGARRYIDGNGTVRTGLLPARGPVTREFFAREGSPVKHLMCWRRELGLRVGFDESLTLHGCDDYDFPWAMLEAGCRFQAVAECLYYYRVHHDGPRLTTGVPVPEQIALLRRMFRKHRVSETEIDEYVRRAEAGYLHTDRELFFPEVQA